jgi:hypothetical protein
MSTTSSASFLAPGLRLLGAAAALCTTSAIAAALLAGWQHAADPVWLAATPEVLAEVAACDGEATRLDRDLCKQALVAARTSPDVRIYAAVTR